MPAELPAPFTDEVRRVIAAIPRGRVATYGQVAALAGRPGAARRVGAILRDVPLGRLPWHRVLAAPGRIAPALWRGEAGAEQARRLRREGVSVGPGGRVDLSSHGWQLELGAGARRR